MISKKSASGLDLLNLSLADVRDGIGPFLGIYLLSAHHWNLRDIGIVTSLMTVAGVVTQTPAGALIDKTKNKHLVIGIAAFLIGAGTLLIIIDAGFITVSISQIIVGIAAAFIAPGIAAITLGLAGYKEMDRRVSRNEMFNHSGNVATALISGVLAYYFGITTVFILTFVLSLLSILALQKIDKKEVDHDLARGAAQTNATKVVAKKFIRSKPFLVFTASAVLFHFANAAMLPLAGQYIVAKNNVNASVYMSACIIVAQLVMVPVASLCGRFSSRGRKPWLMICFIALPLRGFLYTLSAEPTYITSIQILDGLAAGIFGVMSVLTIADITKGTGQFNLANSIMITAVGIGASLSGAVAGFVAQEFSIEVAFLFLSGVALAALAVYGLFMRETLDKEIETA